MTRIESGLEGIAVAETRLSDVDGEGGHLTIGGFAVEELAPKARFEEVLYLLWHGEVGAERDVDALSACLAAARELPECTLALLRTAAAHEVPAMDALRMGLDTLSVVDPAPTDASQGADLARAIGLVARAATIVAAYARLRRGLDPVAPDPTLGHAANYLYMLEGCLPSPEVVRALETYLNTVVDHGFNASTFTARVISSTRSDMYSAIVGAVGALKGPLHGGAPGPALDMVFEIRAQAAANGGDLRSEAASHVRRMLANGERIMGFGHRVYRVRDPRADVLDRAASQLYAHAADRALYDEVRAVEAVVLRVLAEAKPDRRIATNVEFYTALLLHGIGLTTDLFSPTFAVARMGGWTAHVLEQSANNRLIRPAAVYVGPHHAGWRPPRAGERLCA
jgi:citrate synthase